MTPTYTNSELEAKVCAGEVLHFSNRITPANLSDQEDYEAVFSANNALLDFLRDKYGKEHVYLRKPFDPQKEQIYNDSRVHGIYITMSAFLKQHVEQPLAVAA